MKNNKYVGRFRKLHLFTIMLLCFVTVAALLLAETVLGFSHPKGCYIWPHHIKKVFKPYQGIKPGISGESRFEINSLGIRGNELTTSHT